jgi:hypothetical protein
MRLCVTGSCGLFNKAKVIAAVGDVAALIEQHFQPAACVEVFAKPARSVVAAKAFATGELVLGPDTNNVKALRRGEDDAADNALEALLTPEDETYKHFLYPPTGGDVCSPAWLVATTDDKDKANVVWNSISVSNLFGYDFAGQPLPVLCVVARPRRMNAKVPEPEKNSPEDVTTESGVRLPLLINHKPINVGDELLLFKPARQEKRPARTVASITVSDLAKRARPARVMGPPQAEA